jgi:hypothetical protein
VINVDGCGFAQLVGPQLRLNVFFVNRIAAAGKMLFAAAPFGLGHRGLSHADGDGVNKSILPMLTKPKGFYPSSRHTARALIVAICK